MQTRQPPQRKNKTTINQSVRIERGSITVRVRAKSREIREQTVLRYVPLRNFVFMMACVGLRLALAALGLIRIFFEFFPGRLSERFLVQRHHATFVAKTIRTGYRTQSM